MRKLFDPLGEVSVPRSAESIFKAQCRKFGITARKYMGDDRESWAVFVHDKPVFTGMNQRSVAYYKRLALTLKKDALKEASA
jgi:hypothetical protein